MVKHNLGVLALASILSIGAVPALADSAFFSFSVGDHGGEHYRSHHDHWGHGYDRREFYEHERFHHWGAPVYFGSSYYAPRPIVYYQEPTVIERRVIVQEPDVVSATRGRVVSNNPYCREYQRSVTVGNHVQESYGTACRQPDGAWKIVNEDD